MSGRGKRGRPRKNPDEQRPYTVKLLSVPVTDRDEDIVECSDCHQQLSFRQFRIHNLTTHYNLATPVGDPVVQDYKFFTRQLTDMAKLMKISVFKCPKENCSAQYKSALGLGNHLESCGKSEEEVRAAYITCEICDRRFSRMNIAVHRKTHEPKLKVEEPDARALGSKRSSALRAKKNLKDLEGAEKDNKRDEEDEDYVDQDEDEETGSKEMTMKVDPGPQSFQSDILALCLNKAMTEFSCHNIDVWKKHCPLTKNKFSEIRINPIESKFSTIEDSKLYLPDFLQSPTFSVRIRNPERATHTEFHKVEMFESEIADEVYGNNVINVGGPVSAVTWHPSGKYLAIATLKNFDDLPRVHEQNQSRTCIQIYKNMFVSSINDDSTQVFYSGVDLQLVLGVGNGYIHHMGWSSYSIDHDTVTSDQYDSDSENFLGHLAYAGGDSNVEILFLEKTHLQLEQNLQYSDDAKKLIPFYCKTPELRLKLNSAVASDAGQCTSFNWSECSTYLAAGYGHGLVAVFNVLKRSSLLRKVDVNTDKDVLTTEIYPFWCIHGHVDVVSSCFFNPSNPRYLVTTSYDYFVRTWDLDFKREIESKRIGMVLDACWVRGWINAALSVDYINTNYQVSAFNCVKFYQVGCSKGLPGSVEHFNITSISFFEGMVAQATESGNVSIMYFDQYLRECDYDRNKKKKNTVDFSFVTLDKAKDREPKLTITVLNSRRESSYVVQDATPDESENYNCYYDLIRINKVLWCPTGNQLLTAYHNGLVTITPINFKSLYKNYR